VGRCEKGQQYHGWPDKDILYLGVFVMRNQRAMGRASILECGGLEGLWRKLGAMVALVVRICRKGHGDASVAMAPVAMTPGEKAARPCCAWCPRRTPKGTAWGVLYLLAVSMVGCGPGAPPGPRDARAQQAAATPPQAPPAASAAEKAKPERETWEVCYIKKARVGYTHTAEYRVVRDGRPLVRIESLNELRMLRQDTPIEMKIQLTSLETPDGKVLEFTSRAGQEAASMVTEGRVADDKLELKVTTTGKTMTSSIPWSPEYGAFFATEQSLRRQPMKPGERRTVGGLVPFANEVSATELVARDYGPVELPHGVRELLRIDGVTKLGGQPLATTTWCDRAGEVWKSHADMLDMESCRTTKEVALGESAPAKVDLIGKMAVPVDRPLGQPHETKRVRYRVRLNGGDPSSVFAVGPTQQVRSIDAHTAEITVWAIRPGQPGNSAATTRAPPAGWSRMVPESPTAGDREPNNFIQSDNPKIIAAARKAAGAQTDPWQVAVALERAARGLITKPDYSQAFASAAEVIESGTGDCTEHAVLLAALARARGIPARVAMGLIYSDQKFLYHMWSEVFIDGRWIPLDATLARGGTDAAYLKLADTNLQGASAFSSLLPVAQVAGRLKIEILDSE